MSLRSVLVDKSTVQDAPYGGMLTRATLETIAMACEEQLNRDVASAWGGAGSVRVASEPHDIQIGERPIYILDELADAPGNLADHSVDGVGQPYGRVSRKMLTSLTRGLGSVSCAISHELCETWCDPAINLWADDMRGAVWAREVCDACEGDTYEIGGVTVSDFLLPEFFNPLAAGPYDYVSLTVTGPVRITAPFAANANGYQIKRLIGSDVVQVLGTVPASKLHLASRVHLRGALEPYLAAQRGR